MKQIFAALSAVMLLVLSSCNSNDPVKEETKATAADTTTAAKVEPPSFKPFTVSLIRHTVKDFDKWLPVYRAHDSARKASGLTEITLGRGLENNNEVTVAFEVNDLQKAKDFNTSPGLKEAMQKGGVTSAPSIQYLRVVRNDTSNIETKDRVMISHHVKDFNAWLKVFDAEGKETRAANGLVDRGIARGIDDPNTVYVLFAISDLAKAKARLASPELKATMTAAGVDAAPSVDFYKLVK